MRCGKHVASCLVFILLILGSIAAQCGYATVAGQNGKLVLSSFQNSLLASNADLYVSGSDGSERVQITDTPVRSEVDAAFSPDGTRIAFIGTSPGTGGDLYLIDPNGQNEIQITASAADEASPDWSPDGKHLLFRRDNEIYRINLENRKELQLTTAGGRDPSWSPDGTQVLFTRIQDGVEYLYRMQVDGSGQVRLTDIPGRDPSWSPDGQQIIFQGVGEGKNFNSDIYMMSAGQTEPVNLTRSEAVDDSQPSWSPDGTQILFVTRYHENLTFGLHQIWVMKANGSFQRSVLEATDRSYSYPMWQSLSPLVLRGSCNGENCGDGAQISVNDEKRLQQQVGKVSFERSGFTLTGRLLNKVNQPIIGGTVDLLQRVSLPGKVLTEKIMTAATDDSGNWSVRLPGGPSRLIQIAYRAYSRDSQYAVIKDTINQQVRSKLTFTLPKQAKRGRRFTLRGLLSGGFVPETGKVIELQVFYKRKWRTFKTLRTDSKGKYQLRLSFGRSYRPGVYRLRAAVRFGPDWPFLAATSPPRKVRVR